MTHVYQVLLSSALLLTTKNNLMPEAICCCLQTCNVLESKVMVANTCILSLVVIGTTVNRPLNL